ncbi:efflux RND transporter periplasmic adaptor subunit [Kovacikia minuta CCNUW1]|uniref:efflux RND transporter periplasmic adaptor subunit n=1 Tax=Kovacikia minuta TaxID=2931930 RepID=UPI001CCB0255|nr:efflux RND transporter periplasmic adaptor subunit [Kovacikia minuta]UBF25388.1 efflux RND transporter periplasmic adaptor subunit [Kovacikia minuta CCNUW1]
MIPCSSAELLDPSRRPDLGWIARWSLLAGTMVALSGCGLLPKGEAEAQTRSPGANRNQGSAAVDVAIAKTAPLETAREYTGTTQPIQEVSIRAQVEGQLQSLNVDVGDRIQRGQILAQIDDSILESAAAQAQAELASRRSEISQLQTQVSDARTRVEQSRLQLQQAETDAARYERLAREGAVTQQQAEQARTQAKTASQVLRSAQEQVRNQQQAIAAATGRVTAQQAVVAQQQERRSYAVLTSPINGSVLNRLTEQGNLVQPGNELLRLGDFSRAKVTVQVSELELANVRLGSTAQVRLDAFPQQQFTGRVTRVSPAANPTSRLIPVEVTIPNPTGRIGSGLLARVTFGQRAAKNVVVPLTAIQDDRTQNREQPPNSSGDSSKAKSGTSGSTRSNRAQKTQGVLFVVTGEGEQASVASRSVALGQRADGKVEILSGLKSGERFVIRSGKPLKDGEKVRLSILSEK